MNLMIGEDFIINTDETAFPLDKPEKYYTLEYLQEKVRGYIEEIMCPFSDKHIGIVNEEGLLKNMKYNKAASELFKRYLVGPVLVVSKNRMET